MTLLAKCTQHITGAREAQAGLPRRAAAVVCESAFPEEVVGCQFSELSPSRSVGAFASAVCLCWGGGAFC